MSFTIRHLNKYIRWVKNERKVFRDTSTISMELARLNLRLDTALLRNKKVDQAAMAKHEWILNHLRSLCPETLEKYSHYDASGFLLQPQEKAKVWSMWWQGEENAAPLFRLCIESAKKHTHRPVTVLSKDNFDQFIHIPDFVLQKQKEGKIALQHVCDLMVVSVLAEQGGFFTGATVFVSQDVPDEVLDAPFYTCKAVSKSMMLMSRSRWVGYLMGGQKDFPLFTFARDFLLEYWSKSDKIVDYLLLDYIFELAYETIPLVRKTIDALPDNNLQRNVLIDRLSEPYDAEHFREFTDGDTMFYKLSWKFGAKDLKTADGRMTNYGHLMEAYGIGQE